MKRTFIFTVLAMIILAACSPASASDIHGVWQLVSYGDPASPTPAAPDVDTSIEFKSDGTLGGNVGCNGFGGDYTVRGSTIEFEQMISTLMFCEGSVGEQESAILTVFAESASFTLDSETLTITSADGESVVVLARK